MRTLLLGLVLALLFVPVAAAGPRTVCIVTPDPVSISSGEQYTISATGGDPLEWYEVIVRQLHDSDTDERRDWLGQADDQGNVVATLAAHPPAYPGDGLLVGDAKVTVTRYRTGGGPGGAASTIATCSFSATP